MKIPKNHPRAKSLYIREKIIEEMHSKIVAEAGLIAHGRGEAFDYLLGEKTPSFALEQEKVAVGMLLLGKKPVISVNGNVAALCSKELVELSLQFKAPLEVNLFYNREEREKIVAEKLLQAGATKVLGLEPEFRTTIRELKHSRRIVDKRGIYSADIVFVPLEDGDRTMALRKLGKKVITIDLNPLSRTSIWANVTIVNNIIRALPEMLNLSLELKKKNEKALKELVRGFDNYNSLQSSLEFISNRLLKLAKGELERPKIEKKSEEK
ncbi:MAG: phosphopantothenate/pantothenate synthetase [Candidatus Heimdallarchaeaceae archaeon]